MTKQVRWKCANCDHGLLAPTKPRKNDVRRYCLPCSAKTGKLVERISPTLEKQRTIKSEQRKVKVQQLNDKKKVVRDKKSVVVKRNAAIQKEGERVWKLMQGWHKGKRMPKIKRDVHHKEFYKALKHACEKRWKVSVSFAEVRGDQYGYAVDDLIEDQVLKDVQFRVASIR